MMKKLAICKNKCTIYVCISMDLLMKFHPPILALSTMHEQPSWVIMVKSFSIYSSYSVRQPWQVYMNSLFYMYDKLVDSSYSIY